MTKIEEKKARVLMEMRRYQEIRRSELEGAVEFLVKAPRRDARASKQRHVPTIFGA